MSSSGWLLLVLALPLGAAHPERFESVEPHMGTLVRIVLYTATADDAATGFRAAFDRIATLDAILSDYRPDSEVSRLPGRAGTDLFRVLEAAQQMAIESRGAFDVTIGPLSQLWRAARRTGTQPDPAALADARSHVGYHRLHLDPATREVAFEDPAMRVDLGGIAKGYAADEALGVLAQHGIRRALVAMSGDLSIGDPPPGRAGWKVDAGGSVVELSRCAVSTSGDTEQHLDAGGVRYSHIIDPETGIGLTRRIVVTVIAPKGIEADALATAISVMGADRGRELASRRPGVTVRIAGW